MLRLRHLVLTGACLWEKTIFLLDSELPSNTSRLDVLNRPGTKSSTKRKISTEHASVRTIRTAMAPRQ